jgi:hypothetical protein
MEEVEQSEKRRLLWIAQTELEEALELLLDFHVVGGH